MTVYTDDEMAQAIIDLLKLCGGSEPIETSLKNAKLFSPQERQSTIGAHQVCCRGKFGDEVAEYRKTHPAS